MANGPNIFQMLLVWNANRCCRNCDSDSVGCRSWRFRWLFSTWFGHSLPAPISVSSQTFATCCQMNGLPDKQPQEPALVWSVWHKLAFHDADTDTDTDTDFLADILARMSACRRTCHIGITSGNRASDVSTRILARTSV